MRRREFIMLIGGSAAWPLALRAQQPAMPVVGYLHIRGQEDAAHEADAFRRGLRDGGFVEGNNVRVEYRWASGHYDRLQALAAELVSLPVSVLAASGGESTVLAAKSATSTIPIVFTMSSDPVKLRLGSELQSARHDASNQSAAAGNPHHSDHIRPTVRPGRCRCCRQPR
jgi:putative tryptophan/tyrosine transport system substrate-binding protein